MKRFMARYQTTRCEGSIIYDSENEMYADLEVQDITEKNENVLGIDYYELAVVPGEASFVARRWDFGKPYLKDYLRKHSS